MRTRVKENLEMNISKKSLLVENKNKLDAHIRELAAERWKLSANLNAIRPEVKRLQKQRDEIKKYVKILYINSLAPRYNSLLVPPDR